MELFFTEHDFLSIKNGDINQKNDIMKAAVTAMTLRCILFYSLGIVILLFMWIYIACFFTVFQNTQLFVLKNTLICFAISMVGPFLFYLFPSIFRKVALESRESKNRIWVYLFSKILAFIF